MLLAQCQKVSPGINWIVPLSDMLGFLRHNKDTAAGPDGIPYSCWAANSIECKEILYQAYLRFRCGHPLPGGFNHGATVFLAKNLEGDSLREVQKTAAETRPFPGQC
eukprot:9309684-Pyramimonas_sp.AAC.1